MDYFFEIKIMEDPEFSAPILMNALFSKLHRALVEVSQGEIAVSFPQYKQRSLGKVLRLHGSLAALERLETVIWRKGLGDYTEVSAILPVPEAHQHCLVSRVHAQGNLESVRRRAMKRHSISYEEACTQIPKLETKQLELPFVQIKSQSTGETFRLFIKQTSCLPTDVDQPFSKYGLSSTTSVPWF